MRTTTFDERITKLEQSYRKLYNKDIDLLQEHKELVDIITMLMNYLEVEVKKIPAKKYIAKVGD